VTRLHALDAGRVPARRRQTGLTTVELMVAVIIAAALLSMAFAAYTTLAIAANYLYSMGPDGRSSLPLAAKHSRDDIVRANDGAFIGAASKG
jgi:hypothetical protein